jgi:S1-C subfamily serine protease
MIRRLVIAVILLTAPVGCGGQQRGSEKPIPVRKPPRALEDVVAQVQSGVVRIESDLCDGSSVGTGFLLTPRLIATVEHVVDGATGITLKRDGRTLTNASVIGSDPDADVALLRSDIPIHGHEFAFAARAPRLGEELVTLGFPLGLPLTVTRGSVSGTDRSVVIRGTKRKHLIQTDAALNQGNSGGPLITADTGQVLGLADLKNTAASGVGFAVSAGVARQLLKAWQIAPVPEPFADCAIG